MEEEKTVLEKGAADKKNNKKESSRMELIDWVQCLVAAVTIGILLFVFVGRVVNVNGTSMYDTLCNSDKVICSKLFYTPRQGDIVVFRPENTDYFSYSLVKRIIAVGGQTVDIDFDAGIVYVDGEALDEPYIYEETTRVEDFHEPVTVPEGKLFVMGDNRNGSTDSRSNAVGLVDEKDIIGKVYWLIIPGTDVYGSRDFSRIGSVYR